MPQNSERRLLFIAYEYPPSAGGGAQRIAKFVRFLREDGWDIRVLTAEPVAGQPLDETLLAQVEGVPVTRLPARHIATRIARLLSPLKALASATRSRGTRAARRGVATTSRPASSRLSRWIAVPDDAVIWARKARPGAAAMHAERPFDAVLASGPPYSALVVAARFGESHGVPVVLDLRDPWRDNINIVWPTSAHARRSEALERYAVSRAAAVTCVSQVIADEARDCGARVTDVVPNGFDPAEMPLAAPSAGPLRLVFLGRFSPAVFDPAHLFGAVRTAVDAAGAGSVTLDVYGPDAQWIHDAAAASNAGDLVTFHGFRPYAEALAAVARADIGVIVIADEPGSAGIYSGKLFDYLGIRIPVLLYGPDGVAADVVREAGGVVVPYGDGPRLSDAIVELAARKRERGTLEMATDDAVRARFDRRAQVARVSALLADAIGERP